MLNLKIFVVLVLVSYGAEACTMAKKEECSNGKYLEEYMVLNMKTGKGKVGRIEHYKR